MNICLFKVLQQGETTQVDSQKAEGGKLSKCIIVLQDFGGKFENQYVAVILGEAANKRFGADDLVAAKLRFQAREYNGLWYQDIMVQDIQKIGGK